jgi:predicted RNA binding protein with dsRBD fold (UPF0201 family)
MSYFEQTFDLLDLNQMSKRKELSAIDAVMNLTHDISLSLKEKKSTTYVFLDVKEAYDYVSIKQLLNVMKKLRLSSQARKWIEEFMNNRSIELAFDEKKQKKRQIRIEISQESSISWILFLIDTRFLFAKLKIDVNIAISSFVNDIVIYTSSKKIEINCEKLNQVIAKAFNWARENVVKFDDSKSEMIHFEQKKKMLLNTITLSNETTLKSQKSVKWLEIYIDKKLNFKEHVNKRVVNATRTLHLISRLQNIEWKLSSMTNCQLYMTCMSAISDYESKIWWKSQKQFRNKLQKLQNAALRKISKLFEFHQSSSWKLKQI